MPRTYEHAQQCNTIPVELRGSSVTNIGCHRGLLSGKTGISSCFAIGNAELRSAGGKTESTPICNLQAAID
tara:strand:- start:1385 stop:1597 length:213 start_codon:yes stop_codon:yes gene_type:complete